MKSGGVPVKMGRGWNGGAVRAGAAAALLGLTSVALGDETCLHGRLWAAPGAASIRTRTLHFDEASGRDARNYPPHCPVDFEHTRIELDIADMNTPRLAGVCTHRVRVVASSLGTLALKAGPQESMRIKTVTVRREGAAGVAATFEHVRDGLAVRLSPALRAGEVAEIAVAYDLHDPPEGMTWTPESPAWPGRPAQIHTQGQPESNRYWFPCHDFPNERASQTVVATVPAGFVVSSNGRLVSRTNEGDRERWEWALEKPHVAYLASLVIGRFDVVELPPAACGTPLTVYAPLGRGGDVARTYGRTGAMLDFFSMFTGVQYPWPRYAQLVVHNFVAGGMENTSATTMHDTAILDERALQDGDLDGLISHELAHQWFGDLVTCNSWEHIWLNEGFATYMTHLWTQRREGDAAYLAAMHATRAGLVLGDRSDPAPAPFVPAMCSKEHEHPWEVFRRGANPYPKGAFILHMLRERLGDEVFRAGVRTYLERFAFRTAETRDLRLVMEEVSGLSLERFFDQWCFRPGVPRVRIETRWESAASELVVTVQQLQPMDGYNPAFALSIPVMVRTGADTAWSQHVIETNARTSVARVPLTVEPEAIEIDPRVTVLADIEYAGRSTGQWVRQLRGGGTLGARLDAASALGASRDEGRAAAAPVLGDVLADEAQPHALRIAAAVALGRLGEAGRLLNTLGGDGSAVGDARVRSVVIAEFAAAVAGTPEAGFERETAAVLSEVAARDGAYSCRAAAVRGLGTIGREASLSVVIAALHEESQHDQVRQAAIEALAALDIAAALEPVAAAGRPGVASRTRAVAATALGRLYAHDRHRVLTVLTALLGDPESRTRRAAGEALAATGSAEARDAIGAFASTTLSEADRAGARQWLRRLADQTDAGRGRAPDRGWVQPRRLIPSGP